MLSLASPIRVPPFFSPPTLPLGMLWNAPLSWHYRISLLVAVLVVASALGISFAPAAATAQRAPSASETSKETHARKLFVRGMTRAFLEDYDAAIAYYEQALGLSPKEAPILSALADAKLENDEVSTAIYYAEKARNAAPGNISYHRQLARLHREAGQHEEAIQSYQRLLDRFPSKIDARMHLAEVQVEAQRPEAAIETYESVLEADQASPQLHVALLRLYRQTGDVDGVESSLTALMRLRPEDQLYPHLLGRFYVENGRTGDAISLYEELLTKYPGSVNVIMRLASLYRSEGQTSKADKLLEQFVNDVGATPDQLAARARSLINNGEPTDPSSDSERFATAEQLLQRALEKEPNHTEALMLLGDVKYNAADYAQAAEFLERALQQNPRSPSRWTRASAAYLRAGQADRALNLADEGLLLFPGQAPLIRVSAYAHMQTGRNATAISRFQDALQQADDTPQLRSQINSALGLLHARLQQFSKSDAAYARALDADPENADAANNYAFSLADRDVHLDRALSLAKRAVRIDSTNAAYLDTLGWIYFKRGNLSEAESILQQALDTGDASAAVYEHYGDVSEALGRTETARQYWEQALKRAPEQDRVQEKLNALQDR